MEQKEREKVVRKARKSREKRKERRKIFYRIQSPPYNKNFSNNKNAFNKRI